MHSFQRVNPHFITVLHLNTQWITFFLVYNRSVAFSFLFCVISTWLHWVLVGIEIGVVEQSLVDFM